MAIFISRGASFDIIEEDREERDTWSSSADDTESYVTLSPEVPEVTQQLSNFEDSNQLKTQSHTNTKKISEMQYQFDDARIRIDKLLRRSTSHREYDYDLKSPIVLSAFDLSSDRKLERTNSTSTTGSSEPTTPTIHKTAVTVNPKKMLREVSITLKCQED